MEDDYTPEVYTCPNCDWEGDDPGESNDGEGEPICPSCGWAIFGYDD